MELTDIGIHILLFVSLFFEVFLLLTFMERRKKEKHLDADPSYYPSAVVIVPAYNEEAAAVRTVNSLLSMDYPKDKLRVIVVDDGSRDRTWEMLQVFKDHPQVTLYHKENGGKHTALNFGLERSSSELVACLDADSHVDPGALKEIVKVFEAQPELKAVIPAIIVHDPKNTLQLIQKAEYALSIFVRKVFTFIDANFVTPGPLSTFKREVFEKLGPYKEAHNTEDLEMALRMQTNFMKIGNAPKAKVYTNAPASYRALFKQRVRWTYGFIKNFFDYKHILFKRKYGNISLFILPTAFLSIFSAIYFTALIIVQAIDVIQEKVLQIQTVGWNNPSWQFDWFYINTQSVLILTITIILTTFYLMSLGKQLIGERRVSFDMFLYMFFYGFLAPWWLARAAYNAARSKKTSWTSEIDSRSH